MVDALLELLDAGPDDATVGLQLGLAGASRADAATGAREVRPHAGQTGQLVLELSQLDLQPTLMRAGVLGEDVEDQAAPIEHLDRQQFLQRLLLLGAELIVGVEHGEPRLVLGRPKLLGLALSEIPVGVDVAAVLRLGTHHFGSSSLSKAGQLGKGVFGRPAVVVAAIDSDEEGTFCPGYQVDGVVSAHRCPA